MIQNLRCRWPIVSALLLTISSGITGCNSSEDLLNPQVTFDLSQMDGTLIIEDSQQQSLTIQWSNGELLVSDQNQQSLDITNNESMSIDELPLDITTASIKENPEGLFCSISLSASTYTVRCFSGEYAAQSCSNSADSDKDGLSDCEEAATYGTNPWWPDSDGDGQTDAYELEVFDSSNSFNYRNPLISDLAEIQIELRSLPKFVFHTQTSSGTSVEISTSHSTGISEASSRETGSEVSREIAKASTHQVGGSVEVESEISLTPKASVTVQANYSWESSRSESRGSTLSWSQSQAQENSRTYETARSAVEDQSTDVTHAEVIISARIKNLSNLAFNVNNLELSMFLLNAQTQQLEPMASLSSSSASVTLAAGSNSSPSASSDLIFKGNIAIGEALRSIQSSAQLVVLPSSYQLQNQQGELLLADQEVQDKTASIEIDFGGQGPSIIKEQVNINNGFSKNRSLLDILTNTMGFTVNEGDSKWVQQGQDISQVQTGLLSINNVAMNEVLGGFWVVAHNYNADSTSQRTTTKLYNLIAEGYQLADIQIRARDKVSIVYVQDKDRDGLSDEIENNLGTRIDVADTDEDGLSDMLEVLGWYSDMTGPDCSDDQNNLTLLTSDPTNPDSNNNGTNDYQEAITCKNPNLSLLPTISQSNPSGFYQQGEPIRLEAALNAPANNIHYQWLLESGTKEDQNYPSQQNEVGSVINVNSGNLLGTQTWRIVISEKDLQGNTIGTPTEKLISFMVVKNIGRAVFLDASASTNGNGSWQQPFNNLDVAIDSLDNQDLYIKNTLSSKLVRPKLIKSGNNIFGGFDDNWVFNGKTRIRSDFNPGLTFQIHEQASQNPQSILSGVELLQENTSDANHVKGLEVIGAMTLNLVRTEVHGGDASVNGASAYGIFLNQGAHLDLQYTSIYSGQGQDGIAGNNGARGANYQGWSGGSAAKGSTWEQMQGNGPKSNHTDSCQSDPNRGRDGANGQNGANGNGFTASTFDQVGYLSGDGHNGQNGASGGGGEGCWPDGISYGGNGGQGGFAGQGGQGGGGSFALWSSPSTQPSSINIWHSYMQSNRSGRGGNGGYGGLGGLGQNGYENGANHGGDGGQGGRGGAGHYGQGGMSAVIFLGNNTLLDIGYSQLVGQTAQRDGDSFIYYYQDINGGGVNDLAPNTSQCGEQFDNDSASYVMGRYSNNGGSCTQ